MTESMFFYKDVYMYHQQINDKKTETGDPKYDTALPMRISYNVESGWESIGDGQEYQYKGIIYTQIEVFVGDKFTPKDKRKKSVELVVKKVIPYWVGYSNTQINIYKCII